MMGTAGEKTATGTEASVPKKVGEAVFIVIIRN
jgi:hypothetical protein